MRVVPGFLAASSFPAHLPGAHGDRERREVPPDEQFGDEFPGVHSGHLHVGQQHVKSSVPRAFQRGPGVGNQFCPVAEDVQKHPQHPPEVRVIFDHQDTERFYGHVAFHPFLERGLDG